MSMNVNSGNYGHYHNDNLSARSHGKGGAPRNHAAGHAMKNVDSVVTEFSSAGLDRLNEQHGDDELALMRRIDPDAYKEYQEVKSAGAAQGTREGFVAGAKYLLNWIKDKAAKDPVGMDRERENQRALDQLSRRYKNADIFVGDGSKTPHSDKEFSIILSDEELEILKNGSEEEKKKLYARIDDSMKLIKRMEESTAGHEKLESYKFSMSIGKDMTTTFFAKNDENGFSANSVDELFKLLQAK